MARKASSKPDSGSSSTASAGFEGADVRLPPSGARSTAKGNPQGERGGVHQFDVPPKTARRVSANLLPEGTPQVVSEAKDNMAGVDFVCLRFAPAVLANGSMSSNQSGETEIWLPS